MADEIKKEESGGASLALSGGLELEGAPPFFEGPRPPGRRRPAFDGPRPVPGRKAQKDRPEEAGEGSRRSSRPV
jgi:hypothetical protein